MIDGVPVVDVHVHLAPERLALAVRAALKSMYGWELDWPTDPEQVIADLVAFGTDVVVAQPYAHKPGIAASLNAFGVELSQRHRGVLSMATVHPDDDDPVELLERALADGAVGLKVHCPVQRTLPDDPRMDAVYAACERWGAPILMHAGHGPDASTPYSGAASFAVLMRRHPSLRVCVAHLGTPELEAFVALAAAHESVFLDTALGGRVDGVTLEALAPVQDRVLWGSDYPNTTAAPGASLQVLRSLGIGGALLEDVLWRNSVRFFGRNLLES